MKLNIGSSEYGVRGYINIDNAYDNNYDYSSFIKDADYTNNTIYCLADGNTMPFKNGVFDEIFSNQCFGKYVTNYNEILRILKSGGKIIFGVWHDEVSKVLANLICHNIKIIGVEWMNGHKDDIDDWYTLKIIGIKE